MEEEVRIDKWLWAVRLYKTRALATEECRKGRITINGVAVKPSRVPKVGETIQVRKNPVTYIYKILDLTGKRVGAPLVPNYYADLTPPESLEILEIRKQMSFMDRERGSGRPTKKERRDLDKLQGWD